MFRTLEHLLPRSPAWQLTPPKRLRIFVQALAGTLEDVRGFYNAIFWDLFPATTRQLDAWEHQLGLRPGSADEASRRMAIAGSLQEVGGQTVAYIQGVLRTSGFAVTVHEAWLPPDEQRFTRLGIAEGLTRSPFVYLRREAIGVVHCGGLTRSEGDDGAYCAGPVTRGADYIVNVSTPGDPQPELPEDPDVAPFFLYVGGETFGESVDIPLARREEFERRLLKLRPAQNWIGLFINYTEPR